MPAEHSLLVGASACSFAKVSPLPQLTASRPITSGYPVGNGTGQYCLAAGPQAEFPRDFRGHMLAGRSSIRRCLATCGPTRRLRKAIAPDYGQRLLERFIEHSIAGPYLRIGQHDRSFSVSRAAGLTGGKNSRQPERKGENRSRNQNFPKLSTGSRRNLGSRYCAGRYSRCDRRPEPDAGTVCGELGSRVCSAQPASSPNWLPPAFLFPSPLEPFQVSPDIRGVLIAQFAIFLQRLINDVF